jgi:hypothetical protein
VKSDRGERGMRRRYPTFIVGGGEIFFLFRFKDPNKVNCPAGHWYGLKFASLELSMESAA